MVSSNMQAGLIYGPRDVRIETVPVPEPASREVLVKVDSVGICASDIKKYTGFNKCKYPIILGHEFSGSIIKVGSHVKGFQVGDTVSANPDMPCFQCKYCRRSQYNLCTNLSVIGYGTEEIDPVNGAFAQYVKAPIWNLIKFSEISFDDATYIEPLACVIRSFDQSKIQVGENVIILGDGRIGLLHTQLAGISGAKEIIITGLTDSRLKLASELGATTTINVKTQDPLEYIKNNFEDGLDIVFDTTGIVSAAEQGPMMLAPHGRFIAFAGFKKGEFMKVNPRDLHYKEIVLTGSFGYGSIDDYYKAAELISTKRVIVDKITTSLLLLGQLEDGFKELEELKSIRTIIHPNQ